MYIILNKWEAKIADDFTLYIFNDNDKFALAKFEKSEYVIINI